MEISSTDGGDIIMTTVSQPDQTMEEDNESVVSQFVYSFSLVSF